VARPARGDGNSRARIESASIDRTPTLSPELALVDEQLASFARERMETTPSVVMPVVETAATARPRAAPAVGRSSARRLHLAAVACCALVTLAVLPGGGVVPHATISGPARIEPAATTKPEGQGIRWRRVRGADVYNVILYDGDRRVDLWPRANRIQLVPRGGRHAIAPGSYTWFVYAGFRTGSRTRYGPLLAHGELDIR
jgi:hypothetical protein